MGNNIQAHGLIGYKLLAFQEKIKSERKRGDFSAYLNEPKDQQLIALESASGRLDILDWRKLASERERIKNFKRAKRDLNFRICS